ncbi:MAG: hypothetical protein BroJett011_03750 [Chloroflexota bacterium]|nr:MAG: hypothetical protein BroJett011_03750 [Chloroflexota bacterium]
MPDRANAGAVREDGLPLSFFSPKKLSPRERETLTLLAQGYTAAEIGQRLFLAASTIEKYQTSIYNKLGAKNGPNAVAIALARRLISFDTVLVN